MHTLSQSLPVRLCWLHYALRFGRFSLLTGKYQGNLAETAVIGAQGSQIATEYQCVASNFPARIIRDLFLPELGSFSLEQGLVRGSRTRAVDPIELRLSLPAEGHRFSDDPLERQVRRLAPG